MTVKTIKQIADELGVDKQRIYRYAKKNCINEAHQKNGVMYYDEATEKRIKKAFSQNEPHQESASSDVMIDVLLKQSELLKNELEIKNRQIDELNARLAEMGTALAAAQQTAQAAQALHAGSIKLISEDSSLPQNDAPKKSFWRKIFE